MGDSGSAIQTRTVRVLVLGQVIAGLGQGATLAIGSILATEVSGSQAWAGAAATLSTLGAAAAAHARLESRATVGALVLIA